MNVKQSEIETRNQSLEPRQGALISPSEQARELPHAANAPEAIIVSAAEMVTAGNAAGQELFPEQRRIWKALVPFVAEHDSFAVRGGWPALRCSLFPSLATVIQTHQNTPRTTGTTMAARTAVACPIAAPGIDQKSVGNA
jgi:hypothetical protein